ncbi:MAG: hypothetical protein JRI54_12280 [Deltaproteobacteria bacterium]|nr:hypothetical protein [Deltaproteobacteria bacterium]
MSPLVFAVLVGSIGLCFSIFWPLLWGLTRGGSGLGEWMPLMFGSSMSDLGPLSSFRLGQVFILLASVPFMVVIGLFIYSLFTHFLLILVWGNKSGFEATFRVLSYVMAGYIFNIVPIIGGLVSGIWMIVLQVIGLSQAHGIGVLRVLFAILFLPFILLLLIAVAFIGLLGLIPLLLWG